MITAVIQIGNSDDKLTQQQWSEFVSDVQDILVHWRYPIHFHGCSVGSAPWQNACWIIEIALPEEGEYLRVKLVPLVRKYSQDSIAITFGKTEFIPGDYAAWIKKEIPS